MHTIQLPFAFLFLPFPNRTSPSNLLMELTCQMGGRLIFFAKFGRYWLMYTMYWYTIYPCTIEPLGCALCLTISFNNFNCLSTIHIDLVCISPHNSISSTLCMRYCSWELENAGGKYFCISDIRRGISLLQYVISSLWIYLDENHIQMMQENHMF